MLKSIGSLHNVPVPSAAVLGESLKLLATFGDKKSIGTLLEQVREVQAQNEQVFREAQEAIGKLAVQNQNLEDSRNSFARKLAEEDLSINRRQEELSQAEARLSGKAAKFADEHGAAMSSLEDKHDGLVARERMIIERESILTEKERGLRERLALLENKESAMRTKEQQLQAKEQKLRAALDGG